MAFETDMFANCDGLMYCMAGWANGVTEGMFWTLVLVGFAIVLYMATFRFGNNRAFGFASVAGALGSFFLMTLELIPAWISVIFIILGALGLVVMLMNER